MERLTRTKYAISWVILIGSTSILFNIAAAPMLFLLIGSFVQIYLAIGRLKDMNANPWWSILTILPFVGFILMFPKGTKGSNQYGQDPRLISKE